MAQPRERTEIEYDGDAVTLELYDETDAAGRVEIARDRETEGGTDAETWTFTLTQEMVAEFRNSSTVDDLLADPDIPEWVEEVLELSQVEAVRS